MTGLRAAFGRKVRCEREPLSIKQCTNMTRNASKSRRLTETEQAMGRHIVESVRHIISKATKKDLALAWAMRRSVHRVTKADKAKTRAKRLARKTSQTILGFARHPLPVTCLDCGFLALGDEEVTKAVRIMLHCEGSAGLPCSPEELKNLNCTRSLWVDYELTYLDGSTQGIFDELERERRGCAGYLKYRPGFSPSEHRDLLLKRMDRKEKQN